MVTYLTAGWFERLRQLGGADRPGRAHALVLRHQVTGGPEGDVTYDVVVADGRAGIDPQVEGEADLTFLTDYGTASSIASGAVSTTSALAEGRLRVRGDVGVLTHRTGELPGTDPVPDQLRAETEY